eukprot:CAMPEP_0180135166 /NCGR_PEP_ID=MMETSP0986-20121125/10661_1 /TAXON_ID=697907 /ORGANISM="non described non described, Strain CCMP2293" /LENGTH=174 /DNA_ID=CAMNT_0022075797 /DNA_START=483 /DNA_END=1004 /DNA_ORIENTATION=-
MSAFRILFTCVWMMCRILHASGRQMRIPSQTPSTGSGSMASGTSSIASPCCTNPENTAAVVAAASGLRRPPPSRPLVATEIWSLLLAGRSTGDSSPTTVRTAALSHPSTASPCAPAITSPAALARRQPPRAADVCFVPGMLTRPALCASQPSPLRPTSRRLLSLSQKQRQSQKS